MSKAPAFPLPDKALSMHTILLAKTRAGKSSTLRLIAEHGLDRGIPVCIIDPKGDWWGIKSSATGKSAGYPVVIFGGDHADVPINEHAGAHVAELIATGNRPALIDLGGWMPAPRTRFFLDFAAKFFLMTRGRRWLMIDECHNFAPQGKVLDPDSGKMLHWANRLVNEGGGKGVTVFSASQRPQKVHKDYASAHDTLIALRCVHPLDREAVKDWISGFDATKSKEIVASLPELERGEAWCWSPEAKWGPKRLQFPKFTTYDSFAAPTGDEHIAKLKGWASVDLDDVKSKLAVVVEEAKKNDPKALKEQVARLTRELAAAQKHPAAAPLSEADRKRLHEEGYAEALRVVEPERQAERAAAFNAGADAMLAQLQEGAAAARLQLAPPKTKAIAPPRNVTPPSPSVGAKTPKPVQRPAPMARPAPTDAPTGPYVKVLAALAWWEAAGITSPSRKQLAAIVGVDPKGSTLRGYLAKLHAEGLIEYGGDGSISLTPGGAAFAPEPDTKPLHDFIRDALSEQQRRVFDTLVQNGDMMREILADELGVDAKGSTLRGYLAALSNLELIDYRSGGVIGLQDWVTA